ncbi:MAG: Xaa-Pro peptidase family protein [Proteobacteria bacterium]|nr:Xaa-Pro peptidase family protein [Pseudomonadota bacterium]
MIVQTGIFDMIPEQDLLKRTGDLKSLMSENHIDFAIILQNVDMFYFSGTMQKGILVIPAEGEPLVFIEKGFDRARSETPFAIIPIRSYKEIKETLVNKGILPGTAGLELDVLPVSLFERLKRVIGFSRYTDITPAVKKLRAVKSPFEIEQMKKSGQIMSQVFAKGKDIVREGTTELDIEAAMAAEGRRLGHQGFLRMRGINQEMMNMTVQSGYTGTITTCLDGPITGVGVTPAVPQGSSFKKVEKGIPVTVDYGGGYNGYITDETRVFVAGKLDERFKKPYNAAREIIEDLIAYARQGIDCSEIFVRAEKIVKQAHLQDYFMGHGEGQVAFIGHGIGLEINELPVITARHKMILKEGMIFAFEPKFVLHPYGAIGIEVDFIVRPNGLERITGDSLDIVYV